MIPESIRSQTRLSIPIFVILFTLLMITSVLSSTFRGQDNIANIAIQVAPLAVVSIGQTIVLLLAGIDLSVGSIISLGTVIMALMSDHGIGGLFGSISLCLLCGILIGFINGVGISKLKIPPFIMTLSTMAIVKGVSLYLLPSPGGMVSMSFMEFITQSWGFLTLIGLIVFLLYLIFFIFLTSTKPGRYIYATGGDEKNAKKSGVPTNKVIILGYTLSGFLASLAGIILSARLFSGDPVVGDSYSLDSVAAAVVGGTSLFGGIGGVVGTLAGSLLISLLNNILNMLNIFAYYQYIIKGLILLFALLLFQYKRRGK